MTSRSQAVDIKEKRKKADQMDNKVRDKEMKQCVCGSMHLDHNCFYLEESRSPAGWIPRTDTIKAIEAKLAKDEKLQSQMERGKPSVTSTPA